ncbi:MAG TPA: DUF692 domain-containing protein [Candidatus Obscuribacterales bacterium]
MASGFLQAKAKLPVLGVGLGLRRELVADTLEHQDRIDWLEFVPENYMGLGGRCKEVLERAAQRFPLISHGVNLSIGSTDDLNTDYLKSIKKLLAGVEAAWWSDHLCFTSVGGVYMHDLLPLPFSREAVRHIAERIRRVQDYVGRPFLLENISFYMYMPGCELSEAQFMSEVLEKSDCGLLLDVNNVYVNSVNHGFDPFQFLDAIPLERTVQIHVAGHKRREDLLIDTHGAPVIQPVYELLEYVLNRTRVKGVMIERDQNFPEFAELLDELDVIRGIARRAQPELVSERSASVPACPVADSLRASDRGRETRRFLEEADHACISA